MMQDISHSGDYNMSLQAEGVCVCVCHVFISWTKKVEAAEIRHEPAFDRRETHANHKTDRVQTSELYGRDLLFYSASHLASNMLPAPVGQHLNHFSTTKTPLMSDSGLL